MVKHECKCGESDKCREGDCKCEAECSPLQTKAMATAVDQFHKWDDMVFNGLDGVPPLVNVELSAYTMDFFMREKELLQLLFASNPKLASSTNTNMATVLYDKNKLVGIAIEYGDNERAYISMDKLDKEKFVGLADWQAKPELHAAEMRARISAYTGRDIGLIKCADLNGFFGGLHRVVENENTLEMLLEGVKFACSAVNAGYLSIQPEPKFFGYLRMLNPLTGTMDAEGFAEKINSHLPNFSMGLVLLNREKELACVEIGRRETELYFKDRAPIAEDISLIAEDIPFRESVSIAKHLAHQTFAVGVSTEFLCSAMGAALTYSPVKLGYSVAKAVATGQIVVC